MLLAIGKRSWGYTVGVFFAYLLIYFAAPEEENITLFEALGPTLIIVYVMVPIVLYRQLLPAVDPYKILHYTLLVTYAIWTLWDGEQAPLWFWGFIAIPSLMLLIAAIRGKDLTTGVGKTMYSWYLLMSLALFVAQFSITELVDLLEEEGWGYQVYGAGFFLGMISLHFVSNFVFLTSFFPSRRLEEWGNIRDHMATQLQVDQPSLLGFGLLFAHIGLLTVNLLYQYVHPLILINTILFVVSQTMYGTAVKKAVEAEVAEQAR